MIVQKNRNRVFIAKCRSYVLEPEESGFYDMSVCLSVCMYMCIHTEPRTKSFNRFRSNLVHGRKSTVRSAPGSGVIIRSFFLKNRCLIFFLKISSEGFCSFLLVSLMFIIGTKIYCYNNNFGSEVGTNTTNK